jgi:hypothetical protein
LFISTSKSDVSSSLFSRKIRFTITKNEIRIYGRITRIHNPSQSLLLIGMILLK